LASRVRGSVGFALLGPRGILPGRATKAGAPVVMRIAPVTTLSSTGLDEHGTPLADGQSDPHWVITATPTAAVSARAFATLNKWPVGQAWLANGFSSRWISPHAHESHA